LLAVQKGKQNVIEKFGKSAISAISDTLYLLPETQNWEMIPPQMGALEDANRFSQIFNL
jgi:hypothetical protein